jgi:TonB family protein
VNLRAVFPAILLLLLPSSGTAQEGGDAAADPVFVPPTLLEFVNAPYPDPAAAQGVEGDVIVRIDIGVDGAVEAAVVETPSDTPGFGFEEAAVAAVLAFVFSPATEDGAPVPVQLLYRYSFRLAVVAPEVPADERAPPSEPEDAGAAGVSNFTGIVLERGTRDPLGGVVVTVFRGEGDDAAGFETETDAAGRFGFVDLDPGDWRVLVAPKGYYPGRTTQAVVEGQVTEITFYLEAGSYNPFDILVEATRPKTVVTRRTLRVEEIARIPGTLGDPVKVIENLPGVARTNPFSGQIIVRGSSHEDTRLNIGSVQVPIIYHFGGLRSVVPLGMLERVDFYPGNFSPYYGRAIGGVLDIVIKDLQPEAVHGYADLNLYDSGVYVEAPVGDGLNLAVAVRRSYIDFLLDATLPDDAGVGLITAPRYYDYQLLADWRPNTDHHLKFFLYGSNDELRLVVDNPTFDINVRSNSVAATTEFVRGILEHDWTPTDEFAANTKIATGRDSVAFNAFGLFLFNFDLYQPTFRETITYKIGERSKLRAGVDALWAKVDIDIRAPIPPKEGDPRREASSEDILVHRETDVRSRNVAGFFEFELEAIDDVLFIPGARVDYLDRVDGVTFDPRLTVRYSLGAEWALKSGVGLFHQPPFPDETSDGEFGNPNLGPEAAVHYSLGAEYRPRPHLLVDATFYYKDMFDLVARSDRVVERDGELVPEVYNNDGLGRVYGLELLLRHEFANHFFGWIAYTLSRAERLDPGEDEYRLFDFDQTHIFTLVGSYQLPRNWEVAIRFRYVTGRPTTLIVGGVFNVDTYEYEPIPGEVNADRFTAFHQLDLRVDKRWIFDSWKLNLYMDIQNVYNQPNIEAYDHNFDYTERLPIQGLPILPILGLKGEF